MKKPKQTKGIVKASKNEADFIKKLQEGVVYLNKLIKDKEKKND